MALPENHSVLVTGGRGFVGSAVSALLHRQGYRVVALDRRESEPPSQQPTEPASTGAKVFQVSCDISDPIQLQRVFETETIHTIIHLAAILPTSAQRDPQLATQVNIIGSVNLLELARQFAVRRVVFGSSLSVYGTCGFDEQVTEIHRTAPEDLYGVSKLYVERLGEACRNQHAMEFVSLRIGRVIGPGARSTSSAWRSQIIENLRAREAVEIYLPFLPSERILLVHVEDVASMLVTLLTAPQVKHGVYNACCESLVVEHLKRSLESLNPHLLITLGTQPAAGNPRRLDHSRFANEFNFHPEPIFERLRRAANR
jgi:nucleoside-diphosphate-sugar epimerase